MVTENRDTALKFLAKIRHIDGNIRAYQEEIENLLTIATSITSHIKEVDVQSSNTRKTDDVYAEIIQAKEELIDIVNESIKMRRQAMHIIHKIENLDYQTILIRYYLQSNTIDEVADDMHYTKRWVFELKLKALEEFGNNM